MLDITHFGLFILSVLLLLITPGPDMAYIVGQSVAYGRRAGIISATGVALGSCAHAVASVIGLTALITASPVMFSMIKYLGAVYLVFLGGKMLLESYGSKSEAHSEKPPIKTKASLAGLLSRGFATTLTNPKVLLFFVSFFPQFVTPSGEHHAASFLVLGLTYALVAFLTDVTFALLAGSAAGAMSHNTSLKRSIDRIVGVAFIALGIKLALTHR